MSRTTATWMKTIRGVVAMLVVGVANIATQNTAFAGPPFLTDDPEPVDYQHWEIYGFFQQTKAGGEKSGVLPAIEVNYGIMPNAMIHVVLPVGEYTKAGGTTTTGYGDTEFGLKYRFMEEDPNTSRWAVGVFPLVIAPTGDKNKGLGGEETQIFLPVWVQKTFGKWMTYGGVGYWRNPGAGNKNYWFSGWLLQRQVTDALALGGEFFHETKDTENGTDSSGVNIGGVYDFTENHHLLFSVGKGVQHAYDTNQSSCYLGYQLTF
jgi:hypothetical protein